MNDSNRVRFSSILGGIPALMLFYAPFHEGSYWFFIALKWIVFIFSIIRTITLNYAPLSIYKYLFIFTTMTFQPFWTWGLSREQWLWFDILSGVIFLVYSIGIGLDDIGYCLGFRVKTDITEMSNFERNLLKKQNKKSE